MNLTKISKKLVFSITLTLTLFMLSGIAFAHINTSIKWGISPPGNVAYRSNFSSSSDMTARINEAANDWNSKVPGLQWVNMSGTTHYHDSGSIAPGNLAISYVSYGGVFNQMYDVHTLYDMTNYSWYFGTGTPSIGQYDFLSIVKHELGHWYYLTDCYNSDHRYDVMYGYFSTGLTKRTITSHDYLPAQSMYPI